MRYFWDDISEHEAALYVKRSDKPIIKPSVIAVIIYDKDNQWRLGFNYGSMFTEAPVTAKNVYGAMWQATLSMKADCERNIKNDQIILDALPDIEALKETYFNSLQGVDNNG